MDSIIYLSIVILTVISLIVYFQIRNNNKENKIISVLQNFALENNSTITEYDHWVNTLIGIDNKEVNKLFFIRTINNKEIRKEICLSEVLNCRLVKTERTVHYDKEKVNVIDKIDLVLSFIKSNKPDISLEFYNTEYDNLTLTGELQIAEKWSSIIKSILISNKNPETKVNNTKLKFNSSINQPLIRNHSTSYGNKRKDKHASHVVITA